MTVVFFLGGCTYTEIAALRWVGRQNKGSFLTEGIAQYSPVGDQGRNFLIATTGIVTGSSIIDSIAGSGDLSVSSP